MDMRLAVKASRNAAFGLLLGASATGCYGVSDSLASDYDGAGYADDGGQGMVEQDDHITPEEPTDPNDDPEPACNDEDLTTLFLSPDDSNSMSSPVQVREAALGGFAGIGSIPVRTYEFMNYYSFDYPSPPPGEIAVTPSLVADPELPGVYTLQIGVTSEAMSNEDRAPMSITLVLDTSGSMEGEAMDMLKATCDAIAGSPKSGDTVSIVTWDTSDQIVLAAHPISGPNDPELLARVAELEAGGGTDLHGGLVAGYDLAQETWKPGQINRIVLVSDGGANVGVTDHETIGMHADRNGEEGIYMVGVGVGSTRFYNDELMDAVTDAGKGASVYINDAAEADRIFGRDFVSTFSVAARDVAVQLDMPPGFSVTRFSGEEISTDASEVEPQHLALDDSMIFHQQIETCAPELVDDDATINVTVRYRDGISYRDAEISVEAKFSDLLDTKDARLLKGAAVFEYAEAVKGLQDDDRSGIAIARQALSAARAERPGDAELAEISQILEAL